MKDRTAAHSVDSYPVDHVRSTPINSGTNSPGEETQSIGLKRRIAQTTDIDAESASVALWEQTYRDLRELKSVFEAEQYNRGIREWVSQYNSLALWKDRFGSRGLVSDPDQLLPFVGM